MNSGTTRAVIYLRASGAAIHRRIVRQQVLCEAVALGGGWTVVATHRDTARAGWPTEDRPGLEEVLDLVRNRAVDVVIAQDVGIFSRQRAESWRVLHFILDHGVSVLFLQGTENADGSTSALLRPDQDDSEILAEFNAMSVGILGDETPHWLREPTDRED